MGAGNSYAATAPRGQIAFDPPTSATAVSGATATGIGALSVGASANATANGAVAVGTSANATHNNSLAVGTNAKLLRIMLLRWVQIQVQVVHMQQR